MLVLAGGIGQALAAGSTTTSCPTPNSSRASCSGLGLKKDGVQKDGINYQERAAAGGAADPRSAAAADGRSRRAATPPGRRTRTSSAAARPRPSARRRRASRSSGKISGRQLSPNEMKKGATTAKDEALAERSADRIRRPSQQSKPSELGYMGGMFGSMKDFFSRQQQGRDRDVRGRAAAREPDRSAVRLSVAVAAQPYGVARTGPSRRR